MELLRVLRSIEQYTESIPCFLAGQELFLIRKASELRYRAVLDVLCELGFGERSERVRGDVVFTVLERGNEALFCTWSPNDRFIRIVRELDHRFPVESPARGDLRVAPLVTQLRGAYLRTDAGMGYLIRLCDGRFIMIDGFVGEYEEPDYLMDVINAQHVREGKPEIAAWFVTHPHGDHYWGLANFMKRYGDAVELKHLIYNFARPDIIFHSDPAPFEDFLDAWRDRIEIFTPHAGERFVYADASFEVLYAAEDVYPDRSVTCNDTSLVTMMELAGRRVLWLGDLKKVGGDFVAKRYPAELLECEFLQVGHHGYGVNSKKLYTAANPEILMWPCADYWFPVVSQLEANQVLLHLPRIRVLDICGQGTVTYDFTREITATEKYRDYEDGETVLDERFDGERLLDLWWNNVVGGASGYRAATYSMANGTLTADAATEAYSVAQFAQRGLMDRLPSFTLTAKGCVKGKREENGESEEFGLFWNYPNVTVFDETALLRIPVSKDGSFDLTLKADAENGRMTLTVNGTETANEPYEKKFDSSLNWCLKNNTLTLTELKLVKGV